MNKLAISATTLLLISIHCQANNDLPDMQMHIFNSEAKVAESLPTKKMVIFNSNETMQQNTESEGENLRLAYTDDGQVSVYSEDYIDEQEIHVEFYLDAGYRSDKLDWNKAHPSGTPNILSELTWDNLEIAVVELGTSIRTPSNWVMDARFAYGTILDGNNQDSDYFGNNRTLEFSRSNNNTDEGNTIDASIGFGYQLGIIPSSYQKPVFSITPKVGFSFHSQNLVITDGKQTIPATGHFANLDSDYEASWYGPWAGMDSELSFADRFSLTGSFEYRYAYYEATADWNLRTDFEHPESFTHEAEGTGYVASIGSQLKLTQDLYLNLSVDYQQWNADKKGIDKIFFADGSRAEMRLNEVNWESMGANVGLQFTF